MGEVSKFTQPGYKNPYPHALGSAFGSGGIAGGAAKYIPNNGFNKSPYQPGFQTFATTSFNVGAHASDGETIQFRDVRGGTWIFEFVFAGSTPTPGDITVPLLAGGGTAAQTAAALVSAINSSAAPLTATLLTSTTGTIQQDSPGPFQGVGENAIVDSAGSPSPHVVFTPSDAFSNPISAQGVTPACVGGRGAWLPPATLDNGSSI